jgi:hypothetical protein
MAVDFKVKLGSREDNVCIEVWIDGQLRALIYPTDYNGIRVESTYFKTIDYSPGVPMALEFTFHDEPTRLAAAVKGELSR